MSPEFARVASVKAFSLKNPVGIQLGVKGSRSNINYGARATLRIGPMEVKNHYVDIINLDRFDLILGMPFLSQQQAVLHMAKRSIAFGSISMRCLTSAQDAVCGKNPPTARNHPPDLKRVAHLPEGGA